MKNIIENSIGAITQSCLVTFYRVNAIDSVPWYEWYMMYKERGRTNQHTYIYVYQVVEHFHVYYNSLAKYDGRN